MLTDKQQVQLINAAIYAPSADNSQPFQYHWQSSNQLQLWIDAKRSGKASDHRFVLSDIALGAVIESVVIKAGSLALDAQIKMFPGGEKETPQYVALLTFNNGELTDKDLAQNITKRATERRFPFRGCLNDHTIERLTASAKFRDCQITCYERRKEIAKLLPIIEQAEALRFKSETLHRELFSTIEFNNKEITEGMHVSVLAIKPPANFFFKQLASWSVMNFLNQLGAAKMLGIRSVTIPIKLSPALALISISNKSRLAVINGGRALQRSWLTATSIGLSVQPYAAPGIFSLGYVQCEPHLKPQINRIGNALTNQLDSGYGLIFLRLGFHSPVKHKTARRDMLSFCKTLDT